MATKISWCDETINPIIGCSKESDGCRNCYAENMAVRLAAMGTEGYQHVISFGGWNGLPAFVPSALKKPYHWKRPRSIFVGSMGDVFLKNVPFEWMDEVMRTVWENKRHTFILLTKRPDRMREYFVGLSVPGTHTVTAKRLLDRMNYAQCDHGWHMKYLQGGALPNLILGTSVEHQAAANDRIPVLLDTPAAKRFISLEPMVGPVDLMNLSTSSAIGTCYFQCLNRCADRPGLDGVILGGESGNKGRRLDPQWVMTVRDQCAVAGVPFMFKQWHHENRNEVDPATGFPWLGGSGTHSDLAW
jgi:protein gp37